jgi:hypothetical protein
MQEVEDRSDLVQRNLRALILAAIVFGAILLGISSCGDGDLGFPGSIPPTATAEATETPDEDDES